MLLYKLNDVVTLKKPHPCGENLWQITRTGADIKLKCMGCGKMLWLSRIDFEKRVRKIKKDDKFISIIHNKLDED
ncbi:DUF951 domain-containing protein [Peptoniphilus sp. GNH]|nr:DUF951 domain-containing protein [Peptoniphilus sp. GNH]